MIILIFTILIILCFEILIYLKIPYFFKYQINLYKKIYTQINNEEVFTLIAKDILINSIKLFFYFLISILPILIFFFVLQVNEKNTYNLIFSLYNISISILGFLLYIFLRKKFDKRKI